MPVLLLLALAATPEVQLEPAGPVGLALGQTFRVRAASGPSTTLVVWESGGRLGLRAGSIHGARFDPAGSQLLDPEGLLLSAPLGSNPAVAWQNDLGVWLVVYELESEVWLRLVRPDGTFHPATLVPYRVGVGRAPRVASVSMGYVVTAEAVQPVMWRFALATTRLDSSPLQLAQSPLVWGSAVAVAGGFSQSSAVWQSQLELMRATVPQLGMPGPPMLVGATGLVDSVALMESGTLLVSVRATTDAGVLVPRVLSLAGAPPTVLPMTVTGRPVETSVTTGATGEAYVTSVQENGGGTYWKLAAGVFFEMNQASVTSANAAAVGFSATAGSMSVWSTFNDGVFARGGPLEGVPQPGRRQLGFARGAHVEANVVAFAEGDIVTWQVMGGVPPMAIATDVARLIQRDGGLAPTRAVDHVVTRFDDLSVASVGSEYAVLSGAQLSVLGSNPAVVSLMPGLLYPRVTTDRSGRFLVTAMVQPAPGGEAWVFRREAAGLSQHVLFPTSSAQPVEPRLALDRAGTSGLAVINPGEQLWGTRVTGDLVGRDDGGFLITSSTAVYPEVVADEAGGFLVLSTDYDNVWVRRVVDAGVVDERMILAGFWDLGSVVEVSGGALAMATSRTTGDVVAVTLSLDGGVVVARQQSVATGLPHTNHAAAAVASDHVTFVFGRYDVDAGAPTTRFIQWPRGGVGAMCRESWECRTGPCFAGGCTQPVDASVEFEPDAGADAGSLADAGVDDGGVFDAGAVDAGTFDAGGADAGASDAGSTDAGTFDAGVADAGTFDAGVADGGAVDAGTFDAGTPDAGAVEGGPTSQQYRAGCDCQQTGGAPVVMLSALLLWWRRRRSR